MLAVTVDHPQIPSGEGVGIFHPLGAVWLTTTLLVSKGLFRLEENRVLGIDDGDAEYLKTLFMAVAQPDQNQSMPGGFFPDLEI